MLNNGASIILLFCAFDLNLATDILQFYKFFCIDGNLQYNIE